MDEEAPATASAPLCRFLEQSVNPAFLRSSPQIDLHDQECQRSNPLVKFCHLKFKTSLKRRPRQQRIWPLLSISMVSSSTETALSPKEREHLRSLTVTTSLVSRSHTS